MTCPGFISNSVSVGRRCCHICMRKVVRLTRFLVSLPPPSPPPLLCSPSLSTALIAIGQYSSTIETVDAGWCKDITDQGATQIAQSSKSLRYLGLMRCDKVTNITHIVVFLRPRTHKPKGWSGGIWQPTSLTTLIMLYSSGPCSHKNKLSQTQNWTLSAGT